MTVSRRRFLESAAAVGTGFLGLKFALEASSTRASKRAVGYGPLESDPQGILDLPKGFEYTVVSRYGDKMNDGFIVPGLPDGMATFAGPKGTTILIRNHELMPTAKGPFGRKNELLGNLDKDKLFDRGNGKTPGQGGTTTVVYDTRKKAVLRQYLSLAGTTRNCAGGPTPWNSWLSCEETVYRRGYDKKSKSWFDTDHGYNFEVPATTNIGAVKPVPLKAMGRFNHEAVAVDPNSGIVFQTEDRNDGALYRFVPKTPGKLADGGRLQVLKISDIPSADVRHWKRQTMTVGETRTVEWLDIDDVESPKDDLRHRAFEKGAARFTRGEGMWYDAKGKSIFFACTDGGKAKAGQIWRYVPSVAEGTQAETKSPGTLELFVEPNDTALVKNADNLTVAKWGDLIVCEDRGGDEVRIVGVTPTGNLYTFARNHKKSEFAGATFSPDGTTLFVNIQKAGLTLAITGPWKRGRV